MDFVRELKKVSLLKQYTNSKFLIELFLLTGLYFFSAKIGLYLEAQYGGVTPIWPPSGIAVAVFWTRGRRYWPMIIVGEFFIGLSLQQPYLAGIIGGIAQTIEATLAVYLLKYKNINEIVTSARSILWFSVLGALVPPLLSSAIGSYTLQALGLLTGHEVQGMLTWWLGNAIGIMVFTPPLVGIRKWPFRSPTKLFQYIGFTLFMVIVCLLVIFFGNEKSYYLFFILIPFVAVSAVHFSLIGASSAIIILAVIVFQMRPQDLGRGDFITAIRMTFVGTCAFTGYLVASFVERRKLRLTIINRQNSYMNTLHELVLGLIANLEIDRLIESIVSRGCQLLNTDNGFFFQKDKDSNDIILCVGKGIYDDLLGYKVKSGVGVVGKVWESGNAIMINDYQRWEGRHPDPLWDSVSAIIGVPIKVDAELIGVLGLLYNNKGEHFCDEDLFIIERFGELASIAFKNASLFKEITYQLYARENAEKALSISEKNYREIFNAINDAMFVFDPEDGKIIQANNAAMNTFGLDENYRDEHFISIISGNEPPFAEDDMNEWIIKSLNEGPQVFEWRRNKNKKRGDWFEFSLKKAIIADQLRIVAVARIINDRKNAEANLQQLQTAINFAVDDIMITDNKGTILYVNPAFERVTGYSSAEVIGKKPKILNSGLQDDSFYKVFWDTILAGNVWTGRIQNKCKDGKIILQEASVAPFRTAGTDIAGFVSIKRDITEHEQIKRQLIQSQKMKALGTLAGGIAHDFNNILAGMIGYTELALTYHLPHDHPAAENMREVLLAGKRAVDLVKQILTFSRSTDVELKSIDVKPITKEVIKFLSATLPQSISLKSHISAHNTYVMGSPSYIHQILMNLMTNAMQAFPDDKGMIELKLSNIIHDGRASSEASLLNKGEYLEISISDTGCGMDKSTIEKIFEPYFTTKEIEKGTGLGLSVVHGIVTSLNGAITVESEIGKGTSFKVYLPTDTSTDTSISRMDIPLPRGEESIMFVDDDPLLTDIGKQLLTKLGYRANVFNDSKLAFESFQANPDAFDLIITDLTMPKLTGIEFSRLVRGTNSNIPIIITTGNPNKIDQNAVEKLSLHSIAQKPLNIHEMALIIRNALEKNEF